MKLEASHYENLRLLDSEGECLLTLAKARTRAANRQGLLGLNYIERGQGLLLPHCPLIHMIGMRFPIDAIFIDRNGCVRRVSQNVRPGVRFRGSLRGWTCVEVFHGESARLGIHAGMTVLFD